MPKVLEMEEMGNFEVLKWMRDTRKRHDKEDREAKAAGLDLKPRSRNLERAFEKHERHLARDNYPYEKNKSVHNEDYDVDEVTEKLNQAIVNRVHRPIMEKYQAKYRSQEMTGDEAQQGYDEESEPKILTTSELVMIHNHAPTTVETLSPMIEQHDERFTEAELGLIVEAIVEILRPDEKAGKDKKRKKKKKTNPEAAGGAQDQPEDSLSVDGGAEAAEMGLEETATMKQALR